MLNLYSAIKKSIYIFFGIVIDFITGVLVAGTKGKLKSRTCSNGILMVPL